MAYKYIVSVKYRKGNDLLIPVDAKNHEEIVQYFINNRKQPLSEAMYFHIYKREKLDLPID